MIDRVLFLGPAGSYSELAKEKFSLYYSSDCEYSSEDSIYKIIKRLQESDSDTIAAVIPIENSIEGVVRETQDSLAALVEAGYRIYAETKLSIDHALVSFGEKSQIKTIVSHPQALAQCREYIYTNWQDSVEQCSVLSTSLAISSLIKENPSVAAIGNALCASLYGVPVIDSKINDEQNNSTRFVLISKETPKRLEKNKVSVLFSTENEAGALNRVLSVFEKYGLNLSYIDSRPSRKALGEYVFFVDFAGHIEDSNVSLALMEIQPFVRKFEVLSEGALCV